MVAYIGIIFFFCWITLPYLKIHRSTVQFQWDVRLHRSARPLVDLKRAKTETEPSYSLRGHCPLDARQQLLLVGAVLLVTCVHFVQVFKATDVHSVTH